MRRCLRQLGPHSQTRQDSGKDTWGQWRCGLLPDTPPGCLIAKSDYWSLSRKKSKSGVGEAYRVGYNQCYASCLARGPGVTVNWLRGSWRGGLNGGIWRLPSITCSVAQSCPTLCDPVDCSPPGSSVHGILQARVLGWVVISSSRGSSPPRDWTHVSWVSLHWQVGSLPPSHLGRPEDSHKWGQVLGAVISQDCFCEAGQEWKAMKSWIKNQSRMARCWNFRSE